MSQGLLIHLIGCFDDCSQILELFYRRKEIPARNFSKKSQLNKWGEMRELRRKGRVSQGGPKQKKVSAETEPLLWLIRDPHSLKCFRTLRQGLLYCNGAEH